MHGVHRMHMRSTFASHLGEDRPFPSPPALAPQPAQPWTLDRHPDDPNPRPDDPDPNPNAGPAPDPNHHSPDPHPNPNAPPKGSSAP